MLLSLPDFTGDWRVTRVIDDRRAGQAGRLEGAARLAPDGAGLRYREEGTLRLGDGPALAATRDYLWAWEEGVVAVRFADGRPFHRFVPRGRSVGTDHPCGPDLYRVAYDFTDWPAWRAEWTVTGLRKDHVLRTSYRRP